MVGDKGDQSRSEKQKFKKKQMSFLEQNRSAGRQLSASFSPSILRGFFSLSVQFFFFFLQGRAGLLCFSPPFFLAPLPGLSHLLDSKSTLRILTNRKPDKEGTDTVVR